MTLRRGLVALGALAAVGVGLGGTSRWVKRRYGRPPHRPPTSALVPKRAVDVKIVTPGGPVLRGWLLDATLQPGVTGQRGPAALVVHGWGGSAADMLPVSTPLLDAGLHVLLLDTRCHGRSDEAGFTSMPTFAEDIRDALDWLRQQPQVDRTRIVLVGHSVGAGACLFVAAHDPEIAAVVSLASMADPHQFMTDRLSRHLPRPLTTLALRYVEHVIGHRFAEFSPIHTIGRVNAPILLLHGRQDTTVPISDAHRLHAQAPDHTTLLVLPEADHNSVDELPRSKTGTAELPPRRRRPVRARLAAPWAVAIDAARKATCRAAPCNGDSGHCTETDRGPRTHSLADRPRGTPWSSPTER